MVITFFYSLNFLRALMRIVFLIIPVCCSVFAADVFAQNETCSNNTNADIVGTAYGQDGTVLYCELYIAQENNNLLVHYTNVDGQRFAEKHLAFANDEFRPSVKQVDSRFNEIRSVTRSEDANAIFSVLYQESATAPQKTSTLEGTDSLIIDAGFDRFVVASLASLLAGESIGFDFLSIVHGKSYSLKIAQTDLDNCMNATQRNIANAAIERACFKVDSTNSFANLFIKPIYLLYDVSQAQLLRFVGQVNVLSEQGKSQRATIDYQYR